MAIPGSTLIPRQLGGSGDTVIVTQPFQSVTLSCTAPVHLNFAVSILSLLLLLITCMTACEGMREDYLRLIKPSRTREKVIEREDSKQEGNRWKGVTLEEANESVWGTLT